MKGGSLYGFMLILMPCCVHHIFVHHSLFFSLLAYYLRLSLLLLSHKIQYVDLPCSSHPTCYLESVSIPIASCKLQPGL